MIYALAIVLSFALVLGLFFIFIRKIIIWGSYRFTSKERAEKTIAFLQTPVGRTFLWRQRVRGVFYILLVFYVVTAFTEPKIFRYFPWYILAIPLVLGFILTILMTVFYHRARKQGDELFRKRTPEGSNRYLLLARMMNVTFLFAILIYAVIVYGWLGVPSISPNIGSGNGVLHLIIIVAIMLGIICLLFGLFMPKIMTRRYKPKPIDSNYTNTEGASFSIHIISVAMFMAISLYGLALGIIGVSWEVSSVFFIVSAIALIVTFPTQKRWQRTSDKFKDIVSSNKIE